MAASHPRQQDSQTSCSLTWWGASGQGLQYSLPQPGDQCRDWLAEVMLFLSFCHLPRSYIASYPTSREVSIGKMPEMIYTSHSCHSRLSLVPRSLTDSFICNLLSVTKKEKK